MAGLLWPASSTSQELRASQGTGRWGQRQREVEAGCPAHSLQPRAAPPFLLVAGFAPLPPASSCLLLLPLPELCELGNSACSLILLSCGVWAWKQPREEDLGERPLAEGLTAKQQVPPAPKVLVAQFHSPASLCWVLEESKLANLYLEVTLSYLQVTFRESNA